MAEQEEDEHWLPGLVSIWLLLQQLNPQLLYIQYDSHVIAHPLEEQSVATIVPVPEHATLQLEPHEFRLHKNNQGDLFLPDL